MVKCLNCAWEGARGDLILDTTHPNITNESHILDIINWNKCPKCLKSIPIPLSLTKIILQNKFPVVIFDTKSQKTFLNLGRILDFNVYEDRINFTGYKSYDSDLSIFKLQVIFEGQDFESKIALKIINILHKFRYNCAEKTHDNYKLFGNWKDSTSIYPTKKCSFCARFYEFQTKQTNGWPLSMSTIDEIKLNLYRKLSNIPLSSNNKFNKIFNAQSSLDKPSICCCNEISSIPNEHCSTHNIDHFKKMPL